MPQPAIPSQIPAAYSRVLLKISGEGFCHEGSFGIEAPDLENIARQCVEVAQMGVQLAIVVGGGNFIRGATFAEDGNIPRATADYMGMLATVINAVALQETMEKMGQPTRVQSAISVYSVCEPFIRRRAVRHLEKGRVLILAAGTGNPFFTTDTCAALRATEIGADVLLKATKVDGIYSADPKKDPNARLLTRSFLRGGPERQAARDGPDGHHALHGAEDSPGGFQPENAGERRTRGPRREDRNENLSEVKGRQSGLWGLRTNSAIPADTPIRCSAPIGPRP